MGVSKKMNQVGINSKTLKDFIESYLDNDYTTGDEHYKKAVIDFLLSFPIIYPNPI